MVVAGASLLHYRVVEKTGERGMGAVWRPTEANIWKVEAPKHAP